MIDQILEALEIGLQHTKACQSEKSMHGIEDLVQICIDKIEAAIALYKSQSNSHSFCFGKPERMYVYEQPRLDDDFDNDWIEWKGGDMPVSGTTFVEFKLRDGCTGAGNARNLSWLHGGIDEDIVAYKTSQAIFTGQ